MTMNLNDIRTGFLIQHYIYKKSCWRDSMLDYFPGCTKILTKISKSKKGDNLHQKPTRVTCPCCLQPHECYGIVSSQYKWWLQRYRLISRLYKHLHRLAHTIFWTVQRRRRRQGDCNSSPCSSNSQAKVQLTYKVVLICHPLSAH